ncbi:hypothetical protein BDK51DRAFT_41939, partial [Blyttiomyces helicus]
VSNVILAVVKAKDQFLGSSDINKVFHLFVQTFIGRVNFDAQVVEVLIPVGQEPKRANYTTHLKSLPEQLAGIAKWLDLLTADSLCFAAAAEKYVADGNGHELAGYMHLFDKLERYLVPAAKRLLESVVPRVRSQQQTHNSLPASERSSSLPRDTSQCQLSSSQSAAHPTINAHLASLTPELAVPLDTFPGRRPLRPELALPAVLACYS